MASPIQNSYQDQVTPYGRKEIILVVSVIAFALAVRLVFWRGILSNDEFNYLRVAGDMWKGQFHLRDVLYLHGTRPLVFMPAVWMFALFGVSDAAAVAWPVLASLLTVLTIYAIARRLYGKETAAYAALLACISPLMVKESTRMLPGAIMNFIIALSALCFIASEQTSKRRSLWLLASGVVFGLMPLAGEVGLVFGCFFPLALLLWRRHAVPSYWPVAAGFAAVTALILLYYWRETGNPMFKAAISRFILENEVQPPRPIYYVRYLLQPLASHGGVFFLSGLAAVVSLFERRRETWLLAAWFIVTVLFIEAGSSSVTAYRPLYKSLRYLSVASVPGVLLAGEAISWLRARAGRATAMTQRPATGAGAAAAVLLVLFAACWLTLRLNSRAVDERRSQLHAIRDLVRSHE
jgi:4-amino-4-deoxy-L-arabinose transferase-like glycosyltransferase